MFWSNSAHYTHFYFHRIGAPHLINEKLCTKLEVAAYKRQNNCSNFKAFVERLRAWDTEYAYSKWIKTKF